MAPRHREFERDEVLVKAMEVFREKGYEGTSMRDLVELMGINRFSIYTTFKSKHELFAEALETYYKQIAIPFFGQLKDPNGGLKAIEAALIELVRNGACSNGCLLCNTIAELGAKTDARTGKILKRYLELVEADFRAAIVRAKELGEIPPSADVSKHARVLTTYSTGLLSVSKVLTEKEARESVRAMIATLQ